MKSRELRAELVDLLNRAWPVEPPGEDEPDPYDERPDDDEEPQPETAIVTAAALVVEWQGDDGVRWLSCHGTLGSGDPAPPWTVEMLCHEGETWDDE
jgi:hypothetical protein